MLQAEFETEFEDLNGKKRKICFCLTEKCVCVCVCVCVMTAEGLAVLLNLDVTLIIS